VSTRIVVGHLVGVYGVKGWLKVKSFTEPEDNILRYQPWYLRLAAGSTVFDIEDVMYRPKGLLVKLKAIDDRDQAAALGKAQIEVDAALLPKLVEGEYYWSQLIGLQVVSEYEGATYVLGRVREMLETGANDVLVVVGSGADLPGELASPGRMVSIDAKERLIPYLPGEFVKQVDLAAGVILVEWDPEF